MKELLTEFDSVFNEEIGNLKDFKGKIPFEKTESPRFCRARPVLYAINAYVEKELDCLKSQGIFKGWSILSGLSLLCQWSRMTTEASGYVVDYKQTVNVTAPCGSYPIP